MLLYVLFSAGCFICYHLGRQSGISYGFDLGKEAMKRAIEIDMAKYPTKYRWYLDKVDKNEPS